jgi:CRP-like cAMP-binding protein
VRSTALFGVLDHATLDQLHSHIQDLEIAPDKALYGRGAGGDAVYTLRQGLVRFERVTERGDRRIVRLAGRGDLLGQEALLRQPYADEAVACTPVQVCRIPRAVVEGLVAQQPALLQEVMRRWQGALDDAAHWVAELSSGPARRRLLHLLLRLQGLPPGAALAPVGMAAAPEELPIWMPRREEMGAMLDITIETASRLVSALRREGVLRQGGPREAWVHRQAFRTALQASEA